MSDKECPFCGHKYPEEEFAETDDGYIVDKKGNLVLTPYLEEVNIDNLGAICGDGHGGVFLLKNDLPSLIELSDKRRKK